MQSSKRESSVLFLSSVATLVAAFAPPSTARQTPPDVLRESAELVAAGAEPGELVGWSVAVDGDTVALGAWFDEGAVYVFVRAGNAWVQQARLVPLGATEFFDFGWSVALEGDTLVVGAPDEDHGEGAIYVFERSGGAWDAGRRITIANPGYLGTAVAIDGGRIAAGAPGHEGAVYVLVRSGSDWIVEQVLSASTPTPTERLGSSVAIRGGTIVAGAPYASDAGPSSGRCYVFTHDGTQWSQPALLFADDPMELAYFGSAVALDGDLLAVGAPAGNFGLPVGAAYVFSRASGEWRQEAKISSPLGEIDDRFGSALALRAEELVVGAHIAGDGTGAGYVFTRATGEWPASLALVPTALDPYSRFGLALAADGDDLVVSAPYGTPAGSAFVFDLEPGATFHYCVADESSSGSPCIMGSTGSRSIESNDFVLLALGGPPNAPGLFLCGGTQAQIPMASGYLCISPFHPGIFRLGPPDHADGSGAASRWLDFDSLPGGCSIVAGSTWYFQRWYRDAGPGGYNLSDGLGATFVP